MSPFNILQESSTSTFHTVEITILSCEDLRIKGKSVKKNTYVVVRTDPLNFSETTTDTEGGNYPSWDQKLVLDMSIRETFINLEVRRRNVLGDTIIGSASVPVKDFMGGYFPEGYLSLLSYRLKDPKGLENGIINVSVRLRVSENLSKKNKVILAQGKYCSTTSQPAAAAFALPVLQDGKNCDGVVTGIPVWNAKNLLR